ncbi:MAG: 4Fe-4S binding protein, partial [Candidatus Omnitrophica bacterium]|nr:4Fe-4S binding protein [Candidatus Omnitrophota bacterium]
MKRSIIKIDEEKCNGCGDCVPNCPEGAIKIVDGKAKLVGESLCDGLGACIGRCPLGAITIEERDADTYDEVKVMENIIEKGDATIKAHLKHLEEHDQHEDLEKAKDILKNQTPKPHAGGCPGMRTLDFSIKSVLGVGQEGKVNAGVSELTQWPIQLALLNPSAPYFKDADLVIAADCV